MMRWLISLFRRRSYRCTNRIEIDVYGARQRIRRYGLATILRASILQREPRC